MKTSQQSRKSREPTNPSEVGLSLDVVGQTRFINKKRNKRLRVGVSMKETSFNKTQIIDNEFSRANQTFNNAPGTSINITKSDSNNLSINIPKMDLREPAIATLERQKASTEIIPKVKEKKTVLKKLSNPIQSGGGESQDEIDEEKEDRERTCDEMHYELQ